MHLILDLRLEGFYTHTLATREGADATRPLVVHDHGSILDSNEAARVRGVREGDSLSEAKAVLRESAVYREYAEDDYRAARAEWLDVCLSFSDKVEPGMPHEASVDLVGHPDPVRTACQLAALLPPGLSAGLARGKWVARLAARPVDRDAAALGLPCLEAVTDTASFLADVPTAWLLPVPPEQRARLEFLGYRWVREVATAPYGCLRDQFGEGAFLIHEAACGRALDAVVPSYPSGSVSFRVAFDGPLDDRVRLGEGFQRLAGDLSRHLCCSDLTAQEATVVFELEDGAPIVRRRKFGKPVQAATPLRVVLEALWEQAKTPVAPCAVRAVLSGLQKAPRGQRSLTGFASVGEKARSCDTVVRTLTAAYGEGMVVTAAQMDVPRRVRVLRAWKHATGWR